MPAPDIYGIRRRVVGGGSAPRPMRNGRHRRSLERNILIGIYDWNNFIGGPAATVQRKTARSGIERTRTDPEARRARVPLGEAATTIYLQRLATRQTQETKPVRGRSSHKSANGKNAEDAERHGPFTGTPDRSPRTE
ncbi:hypothetical protein EVAR_9372_1 [Eumeta japonica]|uniref:Uncharacterized protein n=1 Tax=Eumeta variegata TaxID=151549 RepID=A0A4C1YU11_EUMVA|nr:hypothetical protein EVAR_9372_1 [Eumeta japonica]